MRPVTRNAILVVLGVFLALLALGALPGYLGTGDSRYVEATVADDEGPAIDAEALSERRFPYAFGALEAAVAGEDPARSDAYDVEPTGFKDAFTHTPFEEFDEFEGRNGAAVERSADSPLGDVAYLEYESRRYRLEIVREVDG